MRIIAYYNVLYYFGMIIVMVEKCKDGASNTFFYLYALLLCVCMCVCIVCVVCVFVLCVRLCVYVCVCCVCMCMWSFINETLCYGFTFSF